MKHKKESRAMKRGKLSVMLIGALLFSALVITGCAAEDDSLAPSDHYTNDGTTVEINYSHQRCGACHEGATRGLDGYEFEDQTNNIIIQSNPVNIEQFNDAQ